MRRVEALPALYERRFPDRFRGLVFDTEPFVILEVSGPVTSQQALDAAIVEGLVEATDLHARLGYLEEAPVVVLMPEGLEASTPLAVDTFDLEPLGQRLGLELSGRGHFSLLVAGGVRCRDLYVGALSFLGVGGDLDTRLLWIEDHHGAMVHVASDATVSHLHADHVDRHGMSFTEAPVHVNALDDRRGACDALRSLVALLDRGESLRYRPEPLPGDIGRPDYPHTLGDMTLCYGTRAPDAILTAPPEAAVQPDGNLFVVVDGPPGYAGARLTWRGTDRSLMAIALYPSPDAPRTYDYGRFHDDGTVSMIASLVDGRWEGLKVDFLCENETSEHFVVYPEPGMAKAVSRFDHGTCRSLKVYDHDGVEVDV